MNGIASILERKLGLERDFCAKGSSRSEPLQAKLVADITAVPVPAVILRQVQMHLEVPHLGHSIKIGEQSSDNLLSCQVSAACAKPLRTFVVMCQSHKAGQVRKMTGTSVTSSSSRSHHCLSWGCLLDGAVFITSWRCVAKWTAGVRGPSEPLVGSTKCKHSVPSFRTKRLRRDVDMLTLCVKPLSAVHHTTEATHAFVSNMQLQEAGQVRVMPGTCVTSSIFRGRDFGTWRCPVDAAICNTSHSCLWRLLGNWTACVRLLSHLRLQPLVGSTRYKRSVPPVGSEGLRRDGGHLWTFCAKPLNVHHTTIATHAFVSNRQLQETGQMRKMTGTRLTSCIFRPRGFETLPCPVDIAICSTSHSCLWLLSGNWTACVGRLSHLRLQLLVESTRVWDRKPPQEGPGVKACVKPFSTTSRAWTSSSTASWLKLVIVTSQVQEAGQVGEMPGTSPTSSISRSHHCLSWGCLLDGAVFVTSWRCVAKWTAWTSSSVRCLSHVGAVPGYGKLSREGPTASWLKPSVVIVTHTFALTCSSQLQEAGQVRKMRGKSLTSSIFCSLDSLIARLALGLNCNIAGQLLWKWTSCVGRFSPRNKPLVEPTWCLRSPGHACGQLPNERPTASWLKTSCVIVTSQLQGSWTTWGDAGDELDFFYLSQPSLSELGMSPARHLPHHILALCCKMDCWCSRSFRTTRRINKVQAQCSSRWERRLWWTPVDILCQASQCAPYHDSHPRFCLEQAVAGNRTNAKDDGDKTDFFFNRIMAQACDRHQSVTGSWTSWGDAGDELDFF